MEIKRGEGTSEYGPGVKIHLSGDEVARAIGAWLVSQGVHISGPRTIRVNGELCKEGSVYIDPSGYLIDPDGERWDGGGGQATPTPSSKAQEIKKSGFTQKRQLEADDTPAAMLTIDWAAESMSLRLKGPNAKIDILYIQELLKDAGFAWEQLQTPNAIRIQSAHRILADEITVLLTSSYSIEISETGSIRFISERQRGIADVRKC